MGSLVGKDGRSRDECGEENGENASAIGRR
jgi:hypothetical protein